MSISYWGLLGCQLVLLVCALLLFTAWAGVKRSLRIMRASEILWMRVAASSFVLGLSMLSAVVAVTLEVRALWFFWF